MTHSRSRPSLSLAAAVAAGVALAPAAGAQSLWGMDDSGSLVQFNLPGGPCDYPLGPLLSAGISYVSNLPCGTSPDVIPASPSLLGDMAVNRVDNTVFVTDGIFIGEYEPAGTLFSSIPNNSLPGDLTGLGYDGLADLLWVTDGTLAAAVSAPAEGSCSGTSIVVPAFALPIGGATATDIAWDGGTDSLWVSDDQGFVTNVEVDGTLGPFGSFDAVTGNACGLTAPLQGIAVDAAAPQGIVNLYVTDGSTVSYLRPDGTPAPTTQYTQDPCGSIPAPATNVRGLGVSAAPALYGSPSNGFGPIIGVNGQQAYAGNSDFAVAVAGLFFTDNELFEGDAVILYGTIGGILCPGIDFGLGLEVNILPVPLFNLGASVVGMDVAAVNFGLPIPNTFPKGVAIQLQALVVKFGTNELQSTRALGFVVSRP